ncbi:MAG: hypothetical protein HC852_13520 [Acaryochloridaceae cyanobacterium RU_4_10]|nr:hypothetical protein [Acaryochloridaceae cyanobacterium RU_4_10]
MPSPAFLLVGSVVLYVFLGRQLRTLASQNPPVKLKQTEDAPATQPDGTPSEPAALSAEALASAPIPADDLQKLKGIFGIDTFLQRRQFLTKTG